MKYLDPSLIQGGDCDAKENNDSTNPLPMPDMQKEIFLLSGKNVVPGVYEGEREGCGVG